MEVTGHAKVQNSERGGCSKNGISNVEIVGNAYFCALGLLLMVTQS